MNFIQFLCEYYDECTVFLESTPSIDEQHRNETKTQDI